MSFIYLEIKIYRLPLFIKKWLDIWRLYLLLFYLKTPDTYRFYYLEVSCKFETRLWWGVLDTTLCDKVCQWLATGRWFSPGTPVSPTNKTDRHDIAEILLKVALNTIILLPPKTQTYMVLFIWKLTNKHKISYFFSEQTDKSQQLYLFWN